MVFQIGVKNIQAAGYNGARTVLEKYHTQSADQSLKHKSLSSAETTTA